MQRIAFPIAGRAVVTAIAALMLTMAEPPMAAANSVGAVSTGVASATSSGDATDFSARRRRHYRGGNAAGRAMMRMMIGTAGARQRRDYYYYSGPGYSGYGPGDYGPGYDYALYYRPVIIAITLLTRKPDEPTGARMRPR
jgi:hypothetical protein